MTKSPPKKRLDTLLVERGLAETRTQAQALVMAGRVRGYSKAGQQVPEDAEIELVAKAPFVSRGGEKLAHALDELGSIRPGRTASTSAPRPAGSRTACCSGRRGG